MLFIDYTEIQLDKQYVAEDVERLVPGGGRNIPGEWKNIPGE